MSVTKAEPNVTNSKSVADKPSFLVNTKNAAKKLYTESSGVKKHIQIISKIDALYCAVKGGDHAEFQSILGRGIGIFEVYSFYENVKYWIKPLNKDRINNKKVEDIFSKIVSNQSKLNTSIDTNKQSEITKEFAKNLKTVLVDSYADKDGFVDALKTRLTLDSSYDNETYKAIFKEVEKDWDEIYKPAPILETLSHVCFTITDTYAVLRVLDTWKIIDMAQIAAGIGTGVSFVLKYAGMAMGLIASVGLAALSIQAAVKVFDSIKEGKNYAALSSCLDTGAYASDFIATITSVVLPVLAGLVATAVVGTSFVVVGPYLVPAAIITVIILAITSKGLGLAIIIAKTYIPKDEETTGGDPSRGLDIEMTTVSTEG